MKKPEPRRKTMGYPTEAVAKREAAKSYLGNQVLHGRDFPDAPATTAPPTALEHIDNSLNQRVMRLDVLLENFEHILARMTGPKPQSPSAGTNGAETNPGGRLGSICNSLEVMDRQLNHLQNILDSLNQVA
jgi:hypothetical protein